MSLVNDLTSVADFVQNTFPSSIIKEQNVPATPTTNTFVVRMLTDRRNSETLYHMLVERDYQIVYFGNTVADAIDKMDGLSRKVMNGKIMIPIKGSLRYIRVEGFNFSQPFKNENGLYAVIGVMQTQVREARDQDTYEKIWNVYQRTEFRISLE